MSWFVYAFVCALSLATADALSKKALDDNADPYIIAWVRTGYAAPFIAVIIPFIDIPTLDGVFYIAMFLSIPLDIIVLFSDLLQEIINSDFSVYGMEANSGWLEIHSFEDYKLACSIIK
jgi:drug/metabolite transporter (DMT)-like permease